MSPSNRLNVVTAVSRPNNLQFIQRHLGERLHSFDVRWLCILDTNHVSDVPDAVTCSFWGTSAQVDRAGGAQKNVGLEEIDEGWVYFLDDDNTIHPRFDTVLASVIQNDPDQVGHVFGQVNGDAQLLRNAAVQHVGFGGIDLGQFVLDRNAIGDARFPIDNYCSDWAFFENVWKRHKDRIGFHQTATFYNALADGSPGYRHDWFSQNLGMLTKHLLPLAGREGLAGIEIGSYEGRSSCWFLENVLTHPTSRLLCIDRFVGLPEVNGQLTGERVDDEGCQIGLEERFLRNTRPHAGRVALLKGASYKMLRHQEAGAYDFAFIDGSHAAPDVLEDLVLTFRLLKPGGLLFADDYQWSLVEGAVNRPKIAIDAFLQVFAKSVELLHSGYSVALRKRTID